MTADEIKSKFPRASESFIRANLSAAAGLRSTEHGEPAVALAAGGEGEAQGGGCPVVRFEIRRKKLLDVDAKYAAVKFLLDGIVATGTVAGDKEGQITLEVNQRKAAKGEAEFTEITIFTAPEKTKEKSE